MNCWRAVAKNSVVSTFCARIFPLKWSHTNICDFWSITAIKASPSSIWIFKGTLEFSVNHQFLADWSPPSPFSALRTGFKPITAASLIHLIHILGHVNIRPLHNRETCCQYQTNLLWKTRFHANSSSTKKLIAYKYVYNNNSLFQDWHTSRAQMNIDTQNWSVTNSWSW